MRGRTILQKVIEKRVITVEAIWIVFFIGYGPQRSVATSA